MQDTNPQDFPDDDIELQDLPADGDGSNSGQEELPITSIRKRVSLRPRYSLRQRRRQAILTGSIVLVALLVILGSSLPIRNLVVARLQHPAPVPDPASTLPSGPDYFYFQTLPSWGTMTLDGHALARVPSIVSNLPPVRMPHGRHMLAWHAEPFEPLSCTFFVPLQPDKQTCKIYPTSVNGYANEVSLIAFPVTPSLTLLPSAPREELLQTAQNLLDTLQSSETVLPGERYTSNPDTHTVSIASEPLHAQLRFLLDTDTTQPAACSGPSFGPACSVSGNDCRLFCTLTWPEPDIAPSLYGWDVAAIIRPTWTYTAMHYMSEGKQQTQRGAAIRGEQHFVTFHVTWSRGQWHVSFHLQGASSFDDPNCITTIGQIAGDPAYHIIEPTQQVTWTFSSGPNRASGCVAIAVLHTGTSTQWPPPDGAAAYLIQRFGVLLAANDTAHQFWPNLPLASAYEQSVAEDIATRPAFVS